jgi:hypothetical protein
MTAPVNSRLPESPLRKYPKASPFVEMRVPTLEEVYRAVEPPDEADAVVRRYIDTHPELVEMIRLLRGEELKT